MKIFKKDLSWSASTLQLVVKEKVAEAHEQADQGQNIKSVAKPAWISGTVQGCMRTGIILTVKWQLFLYGMVDILTKTEEQTKETEWSESFRLDNVVHKWREADCREQ